MTCGGHFPRGLREPVLAALGTCFLSDTLTSRSLWGLCAVSVKVRRTVVFDSCLPSLQPWEVHKGDQDPPQDGDESLEGS